MLVQSWKSFYCYHWQTRAVWFVKRTTHGAVVHAVPRPIRRADVAVVVSGACAVAVVQQDCVQTIAHWLPAPLTHVRTNVQRLREADVSRDLAALYGISAPNIRLNSKRTLGLII